MADIDNFGYGKSQSFANAGLVAGTGSSVTSTAATSAAVNGKWIPSLAAQTNAATPTVDATTGLPFLPVNPNMCCAILFTLSALGVLQMSQGQIIPCSAGVTTVPGPVLIAPQFPEVPNASVPIAYTIVTTAPSAAPWTPGAGAWAASGVVATTFQNIVAIPNRPQIS